MMTAAEIHAWIGRRMLYRLPRTEMLVAVKVLDAKASWGAVSLLVMPEAGDGSAWVRQFSLEERPS